MTRVVVADPGHQVPAYEHARTGALAAEGLHVTLARAWQQLGETTKARAEYRAELKGDPGSEAALEGLRALEAGQGR